MAKCFELCSKFIFIAPPIDDYRHKRPPPPSFLFPPQQLASLSQHLSKSLSLWQAWLFTTAWSIQLSSSSSYVPTVDPLTHYPSLSTCGTAAALAWFQKNSPSLVIRITWAASIQSSFLCISTVDTKESIFLVLLPILCCEISGSFLVPWGTFWFGKFSFFFQKICLGIECLGVQVELMVKMMDSVHRMSGDHQYLPQYHQSPQHQHHSAQTLPNSAFHSWHGVRKLIYDHSYEGFMRK